MLIMMKSIKRAFGLIIVTTTILGVFTIGASAEWRQDNNGWWYEEESRYATGWRDIDGKWYYFNSDGYMAKDTTIDGYTLGSDGAWVITPPTVSTTTNQNNVSIDTTTTNTNVANSNNNESRTIVSVFYNLDTLQVTRMIQGKQTLKCYYADDIDKKAEVEATYGVIIIDAKEYNETPEDLMVKTMSEKEYKLINDGGTVKFVKE
jgi:hypothetical protein